MKSGIFKFLIIVLLYHTNILWSQNVLNLKSVIDSTLKNYPLAKQKDLYNEQLYSELHKNKNTNLPQIFLNGKASYQNDVTGLSIKLPGIVLPEMSKDQYKLSVDVQQSIYKGNIVKTQNSIYKTQNEASLMKLEIELAEIKKNTIQLVFEIILVAEQKKLLLSYKQNLNEKTRELEVLVKNGAILQSVLDALNLENIKIRQQIQEIEFQKITLVKKLNILSGLEIDTSQIFIIDNYSQIDEIEQHRPEYSLMEINQKQLEQSKKIISAKNSPNIYAFGSAGYGRPGYNMLSNDFSEFYIVGIGLNWKIWSWDEGKHEKNILKVNSEIIDTQKESFLQNLNLQIETINNEISDLQSQLITDEEIIQLQIKIAQNTEILLKNGSVTSSQYVLELQKLEENRLNREIHKIKLNLARVNYLLIKGQL